MKQEEDILREEAVYDDAGLYGPSGDDDEESGVGPGREESMDEEGDESASAPIHPSFKEVIEENAREDEKPFSSSMALRTILGGDILNTQAIRSQVWLILLITFFAILYISNRYSCQKQQIKIDKLNTELKKSKYKTLSLSSVLTERCRESHVLELLRANNDSTIHPADQPPYIIIVPN